MSIESTINGQQAGRTVRRFFSWWTDELDGFFAQLIVGSKPWKTLLFRTGEGLDIYVREAGSIKLEARFSDAASETAKADNLRKLNGKKLTESNIVLRISSELALKRELTLPAAISDVIEPVLKNQVEQIVPWPAEQTSFGYEMVDQKSTSSNITVRLAAIRTKQVEDALALATAFGFDPGRIDISDSTEKSFGLELVNPGKSRPGKSTGRSAVAIVSLFAISLAIGVFGLWHMASVQTDLAQAEQNLATLSSNNSPLGEARLTNEKLIRQRDWLIGKRKQTPSIAIIINALTRLLPDDTQLTRLEMVRDKIVINGRTKNAAELIGVLEESSHFQSVRFYSPTIRKSSEVKEMFSIEAEFEPARDKGVKR